MAWIARSISTPEKFIISSKIVCIELLCIKRKLGMLVRWISFYIVWCRFGDIPWVVFHQLETHHPPSSSQLMGALLNCPQDVYLLPSTVPPSPSLFHLCHWLVVVFTCGFSYQFESVTFTPLQWNCWDSCTMPVFIHFPSMFDSQNDCFKWDFTDRIYTSPDCSYSNKFECWSRILIRGQLFQPNQNIFL